MRLIFAFLSIKDTTNTQSKQNDGIGDTSIEEQKKLFPIDEEKYEFVKKIGDDNFDIRCQIIDKNTKQRLMMSKFSGAFNDLNYAKNLVRGITMLKFFDDENIIKLVDIIKPEPTSKDIYILTEFMECSLHQIINSKQELTDDHVKYHTYMALAGLLYIHSADVVHGNLKPSILLVNSKHEQKISDFQWARSLSQEGIINSDEDGLVRFYRAPELLLNEKYGKPVDIWAIGCILTELLGRKVLFTGKDYLEQMNKFFEIIGTPEGDDDLVWIQNQAGVKYIQNLPKKPRVVWEDLFPGANPDLLDLIDKILVFNPEKRPTVRECLEHPYFHDIYDPTEVKVCSEKFVWPGDNMETSIETLKTMLYGEGFLSSSQ